MSWSIVQFADVLKDVTGGNEKTKQSDYAASGAYPIVDQGQSLIGGYTDDANSLCKADGPVIIFGDHTKALKYVDFPFCLGADGTKILKPKQNADTKYLYYALHNIHIPEAGYSRHFKYLKAGKIPLPPLEEQKRIAGILDQADALRRLRTRALVKLNTLGQAIFHEMFGGSDIPKTAISEVCTKITDGTHQTPTYSESGVTFLSAKNVTKRRIDWTKVKYIPEELHREISRRVQPGKGDILLAKNGTTGIAALVETDDVFSIYVSLALLRPTEQMLPKFLLYAVNATSTKRQFDRSLKGVGVSNLHLKDIRAAIIPSPPLEVQQVFLERIEMLEICEVSLASALARSDQNFASLQHRAFRGEL